MRKVLLTMAVLVAIPAMLMAWPQPGELAPQVPLMDTTGVPHVVPVEYPGHVLQLLFWSSG
jgi:hypothetical protein